MNIEQQALNLCHEIEKLPASEQQTKVSMMASELYGKLNSMSDKIDEAIIAMEKSESPFYEGMEALKKLGELWE